MSQSEQDSPQALSGKEPWLAVNLSMFFSGLGQIYSGNLFRGCLFIAGQVLLYSLTLYLILSPG